MRLYAVLVHHGHSTSSGHYLCYARASNGCWHEFNDEHVRQVRDCIRVALFYVLSVLCTFCVAFLLSHIFLVWDCRCRSRKCFSRMRICCFTREKRLFGRQTTERMAKSNPFPLLIHHRHQHYNRCLLQAYQVPQTQPENQRRFLHRRKGRTKERSRQERIKRSRIAPRITSRGRGRERERIDSG